MTVYRDFSPDTRPRGSYLRNLRSPAIEANPITPRSRLIGSGTGSRICLAVVVIVRSMPELK